MAESQLPAQASLEYLKKLAKERLREARRTRPQAKLADVQLAIAREYGFASWRTLKAELDRRQAAPLEAYFTACLAGDAATLRTLLTADPALVRARHESGATGLHAAAGSLECVRLLLEFGADPNARDTGDNATPLHFAAGNGDAEVVRALLDAGADVHGHGDLHHGDVIGWASGPTERHRAIVALLLERGARHHIFSAIATGDRSLVRQVIAADPDALKHRRSRFEQGQTALHYALSAPIGQAPKQAQYGMADLLIELGADLEAEDEKGRTPLAVAMLHGDLEAMRRLKAAGAKEPAMADPAKVEKQMDALRNSMYQQATPMLCVADVGKAVEWYTSLGFTLTARAPETGPIDWAALSFGKVELMVQSLVARPRNQVALWFHTNRIDELYALFRNRQLQAARAALAGEAPKHPAIRFEEDLYEPFYGGRQFSVSDVNGFELVFQSE